MRDLVSEMNVSNLLMEFLVICVQYQGCNQHSESFEGHGNFCPDHVGRAEGLLRGLRLGSVFDQEDLYSTISTFYDFF